MNVGGVQNLSLFPQAKPAKGNSTEKGETSFDDVLAQSDREDVAVETSPAETTVPDAKSPVQVKINSRQGPAPEPSAMPTQPSTPNFDKPLVADRLPTVPVATPLSDGKVQMVPQQEQEIDNLTRRVVWNDFLRKMKDDLGVSAEDVLNAFQSLTDEELAKPPQQTVDKVVMALGLDGQQAALAKQYFSELISKTQPRTLGEELANSQKQISLTLMSQREVARRMDAQAVNNLQQKFFMQGQFARPQEAVAEQAAQGQRLYIPKASMDDAGVVSYQNDAESDGTMIAPARLGLPTAASAASQAAAPATSAAMNSAPASATEVVPQMKPLSKEEKSAADVDNVVKKFMAGQARSQMMTPAEASVPSAMIANAPAPASAAASNPAPAAAMMSQLLAKLDTATDSDSGQDEALTDASYLGAGLSLDSSHTRTQGPSEFAQQLATVDPAQPMAVPDLVQTARVMVRDGGGEMKVTLAPDGLGEVAMRVSVKEGKVNVQMITESDEAKKLIERQLGELKSSLVSQNLNIDGIKVDTATNIGKQMDQQYQDAQRQMAQQTLEQFRQDQQGWRRSFFETPAMKVYKGQGEAPRDIPVPAGASARRAGSRRLDLVA